MDRWLTSVWFPHVLTMTGGEGGDSSSGGGGSEVEQPRPNLLIADSFAPHAAASVQRSLVSRQSCLAIIPSACSPVLQPLHKGIKQKFKVYWFKILPNQIGTVEGHRLGHPRMVHPLVTINL